MAYRKFFFCNIFFIVYGETYQRKKKQTFFLEEHKQNPCANVYCVEIAAMATATDAPPHRITQT